MTIYRCQCGMTMNHVEGLGVPPWCPNKDCQKLTAIYSIQKELKDIRELLYFWIHKDRNAALVPGRRD